MGKRQALNSSTALHEDLTLFEIKDRLRGLLKAIEILVVSSSEGAGSSILAASTKMADQPD